MAVWLPRARRGVRVRVLRACRRRGDRLSPGGQGRAAVRRGGAPRRRADDSDPRRQQPPRHPDRRYGRQAHARRDPGTPSHGRGIRGARDGRLPRPAAAGCGRARLATAAAAPRDPARVAAGCSRPLLRGAAAAEPRVEGDGAADARARTAVRDGAHARGCHRVNGFRSLTADRLRIPFRRPFVTASGMWLERELWVLQLADGDGRVGIGEAVLDGDATEVMETLLAALIREAVDAARTGELPAREDLELHGTPGRALNAALEAARLDLDDAVPTDVRDDTEVEGIGVNATLPSLGADAMAEAARQSVEAGFATLKLKGGAERETDVLVERVGAVRRAVGPEIALRLDVNGAWDVPTAEDRIEAVARFDLEYVEQPLPPGDDDALAELRRRVGVPIAADESVESVRAARDLVERDAVDVLVVKLARVGGASAAHEIAELAARRRVAVVMSNLFETGVGIAAAMAVARDLALAALEDPTDHGLATAGLLEHDLLRRPLIVEGGQIHAPGGDGSG